MRTPEVPTINLNRFLLVIGLGLSIHIDALALSGQTTPIKGSGPVAFQVDIMTPNTTAPWNTTYACFRVPTALVTADGQIIVLAESRIGDCSDQAPKDVTSRRSMDGGKTWGDLTLVVGPEHHSMHNSASDPDFSARNPYLTLLPNGTILLSWVNTTDPNSCINYQQTSFDGGQTWNPPSRQDFGRWEGVLLGPGTGIVLGTNYPDSKYKGRIVLCGATGYVGNMPMKMPIYFSNDGGNTYEEAGGGAPFDNLQECQLVELDDGTVMVNARNSHLNKSCSCRAIATSKDGGQTWSPYTFDPELVEPVCSAGLINANGSLFFSNPATSTQRINMTLKRSQDDGATWEIIALLFGGISEYSVLVDLTHIHSTVLPLDENHRLLDAIYTDEAEHRPKDYEKQCTSILTKGTRPGKDYASILMNSTNPTAEECRDICCQDPQCRTFVFVPSGLYPQRPPGTFCWLKNVSIPLASQTCDNGKPGCISGIVDHHADPIIGVVYERMSPQQPIICSNCVTISLAVVDVMRD